MKNYSPLSITNFQKKNVFKVPSFFKFKLKKKVIFLIIFGLLVLGGMSWFVNQYLTSFFATQNNVVITPSSDINQTKSAGESFIVTFNIAPQTAGQVVTAFSLVLEYDKDKVEYENTNGSGVDIIQSDFYDILEENNVSQQGKVYLTIVNKSTTDIPNQLSFKFKTKSGLSPQQLNQSTSIKLFNVTETAGESSSSAIEFVRSDTSPIVLANVSFATPTVTITPIVTITPDPTQNTTPTVTITPIVTTTPDTITIPVAINPQNINLKMKFKIQGVSTLPRIRDSLNFNIALMQDRSEVKEEIVPFTVQPDGTYIGNKVFEGIDISKKYSLAVKGAKHLNKVVCQNNPSESFPGGYQCSASNIQFGTGDNDIDFSGIYLLAGDIPQQNGIVDSVDISFIRQNFGNTSPDNLRRGDLNFDGIIDTQDYVLIMTALAFKFDEGE
jgi:mRNA-degrading endonuclease toxin of MazEF toxin-antitoxin module